MPDLQLQSINDLETLRAGILEARRGITATVTVCGGTGCSASRSREVIEALRNELARRGLEQGVHVRVTGCHGFCEQGPIAVLEPGNVFYCHLTPEDVPEIVGQTIAQGKVVERLLYTDPVSGRKIKTEAEIPFYLAQDRRLLDQNRRIDPCSIEDYIACGGYAALAKTLAGLSPEAVVREIEASGLRGRGGGGFPTARKWAECQAASCEEKYVICNADEGDPGAYMDRCLLEGNPHLVLEGMMIGAFAVGAREGYVYVRNEYPLAVSNAKVAVRQAREKGLLGEQILGSPFSFEVEIARGGGAFVCGESTALMASLEGKVGEPRPKDVHTVVDGLWHKPTTLNNVETWANVPAIINNGSEWFSAQGSSGSKGTKILALTGRIKNTGLVEVPMGTPLRSVVFDIGGGSANGKAVKAIQTGGPSGGCLPVTKLDLPLDFDALSRAGSMIGSGGLVVMDEETCMVDVAKYFLAFLQDESCGKCVPCRLGIDRMLEIITDYHRRPGHPRADRPARGPGRHGQPDRAVRTGQDRGQSGPLHPALLPGGIRSPHRRRAVSGRRLPGPDHLQHRSGNMHRLRGLPPGLSPRGHHRRKKAGPQDRPGPVPEMRHLPQRMQIRSSPGQLTRCDMLKYVTIKVDGAYIRTPRGTSILDTAIEYGICIPHLCHVPNLTDIGACRLCIVEHVVNGRSKVTTSCTLNAEEGMVIWTNTEKIKRLRRNIAELLVAQAPNSRAIQDIAVRCGVKEVRYPFRNADCILCGRCVRACEEIWGARAIGFVGRGKDRRVEPLFGTRPAEFCKQCGYCTDLCPMTIPPCDGPMKTGEEYLCGKCESQLLAAEENSDSCVWCQLGEGFQCGRYH